MKKLVLLALAFCSLSTISAQSLLDDLPASQGAVSDENSARLEFMREPLSFFKSQRLITFQTVETVPAGELNSRVAHRFGNAATKGAQIHTLFGLDNASDIWLGVDYGITDNLQVGIARVKGAGNLREQWTLSGKLRLPGNAIGTLPIRLALAGNVTLSTQNEDPFGQPDALTKQPFARRTTSFVQLLAAAAPKGRFVLQVAPAWVWRNYVDVGDAKGWLALPISARFKVNKRFSLTAEYAPQIATSGSTDRGSTIFWKGKGGTWYAPLQVAMELETGGHVFQVSLSNSSGLLENDMLAYSTEHWDNGGFRMGFAIMRGFQVSKRKKA